MARRRKQAWTEGDYFAIPLEDGTYSVGQVVSAAAMGPNVVICAFFDIRINEPSAEIGRRASDKSLVSMQFVTRDLLDNGVWRVVDHGPALDMSRYINLEELRSKNFVGTEIFGSGNMRKLMNAYYGLLPWNAFHQPDYLDKLLVSPDRKPKNVVLK